MDLSILQDFHINTSDEWSKWQFTNQEYKNFPLSFFNKFGKAIKLCNLSTVALNKQDAQFMVVEGNLKTKNKQYISKNITMGDKQKRAQGWTRVYTKKQKKNYKGFSNQYKTKFRQITVKNDWLLLKAINKRNLQQAPKANKITTQQIKSIGKIRYLNPKVQKISWNPTGFKQNQAYKINHVSTQNDKILYEQIGASLFQDQEQENINKQKRISVVCSSQFLFALMTVRGGQYPWAISVSKEDNVIVLDRYNSAQDDFSYLDMFTPNQNTTGNMPKDQTKVRQNCVMGTKMIQIFKDLIASGQVAEQVQNQQQGQQQNKEGQELQDIKKYMKIQIDDIDIYTSVKINGMKKKSTGQEQPCLIRSFVQTGTDGGWIADMKTSQGTLIYQQYLANSCSLHKWICQARLAGVDIIKFGFIGFNKQKPFIVNVQQSSITNLQKYISFNHNDAYSTIKYIIDILAKEQSDQYVLTRNAYSPLSLKLYRLPKKINLNQDNQANQN